MCQDLNLIIEVDGSIHDSPEAQEKDRIRQKELEAAGFRVVRFTNEEVLKNMDSVRRVLAEVVRDIEVGRRPSL